jgi:CRISPR-associated endonuclease/helicase Cas3
LRAYAGDEIEEERKDVPYPRVTTAAVGDKLASVAHVAADETRKKVIHLNWVEAVEDGGLVVKLKEALTGGGCAAVIRNTVGLAQTTYSDLKIAFAAEIEAKELELVLFHARFPFGRRQQIENDVLTKFGKGPDGKPQNPRRPQMAILVATQVIEQSLDLDFDVMVSDVAPVDLVLQRAGRLHRHERGDRGDPRLWLIKPEKRADGLPDFGPSERKRERGVYERYVLTRSLISLGRPRTTVELPGELERLVEQVYGSEPLDIPQGYRDDLEGSKQSMQQKMDDQQLGALNVSIDGPNDDPLHQQNAQLEEDDPEAHQKIQAATRDTEPTIQLVLVYHHCGRDSLDPEGREPFDESETPSVARLRRILDNEVTISHPGCVSHYAHRPVPIGWRKCGMLRHHRLVRVDAQGRSLAGEFPTVYDCHRGVYWP